MGKKIWISWEVQRRSVELSNALGCTPFIFEVKGALRYPLSFFYTLCILIRERPHYLFVQNPSMILAFMAGVWGQISKTVVVVDRHSNFSFTRESKRNRKIYFQWVLDLLSDLSIRLAHLTIVTNDFIASHVAQKKGTPFVLPDKLPTMDYTAALPFAKKTECKSVVLISSFGLDEPTADVLAAFAKFDKQGPALYISGDYNKKRGLRTDDLPDNIIFTGFLSEKDFVGLVHGADIVMALTENDHCMLCGCYEALSAGKPLITSDKKVLRDYFTGAVFVKNDQESIADGIQYTLENLSRCAESTQLMKRNISRKWDKTFEGLTHVLKGLERAGLGQK